MGVSGNSGSEFGPRGLIESWIPNGSKMGSLSRSVDLVADRMRSWAHGSSDQIGEVRGNQGGISASRGEDENSIEDYEPKIGACLMKRRVLVCGANLTALALSLGLMGCGSAGIEEGMPKGDLTPTVKLDPKMTDMTGRSFKDQAAVRKQADEAGSQAGGAAEKK